MERQASKSRKQLQSLEKALGALKLKQSKLRTKQASVHEGDLYGKQLHERKLAKLDAEIQDLHMRKEEAFRPEFFQPETIPLFAAEYGVVKVLQEFVSTMTPVTSAFLEYADPATGNTPILMACAKGYVECAKILIAVGAHVGVVNNAGYTALHCACANGQPDAVKLLLAVPYFDPYVKDRRQLMAIHVARIACLEHDHWACYEECARLLEDRCGIYRGWLFESVESSVVKMALNLHSWKSRFVVVLRTDVHSSTLEMAFYDTKPGARLPPVPNSTVMYKLGTPIVQPGTQRTFGNKELSFCFSGIQRTHDDQRGVLRKIECAAMDAPGLASWTTFFETYAVLKDVPDALLVPLHSSPPPAPEASPAPVARSASASAVTESVLSPPWVAQRSVSEPKLLHVPDEVVPSDAPVPSAPMLSPVVEVAAASAPPLEAAAGGTRECVVCFDGPQSAVCVPCGHNAVCMRCADYILAAPARPCPVCRSPVREIIRLYQC
ncbi:hypothetical protein ACHHYP_20165 [Achlya hypogyna]|uniref:RING-type domain-containing protein n=1 Tax=Achlya hypogyna TaxID=1202772 RepID=A0A1V9Z1M3_ACHHY|nr:hypothetical protein ACHHYP_20165 [Achlya hypogyna]